MLTSLRHMLSQLHFLFTDYIDELFEELVFRREVHSSFAEARAANALENRHRPVPVAQMEQRARKEDIVASHRSRFTD